MININICKYVREYVQVIIYLHDANIDVTLVIWFFIHKVTSATVQNEREKKLAKNEILCALSKMISSRLHTILNGW